MNKYLRWICPALGAWCTLSFGGDSETKSETKNTDARVVGGTESTNISAHDSTVSVIATDHGAVKAGLDLGSQAISASTKNAGATIDAAGDMFAGAVGAVSKANENLALAYQSGNAGEQTQLKYAGFIVVGLAAVMIFKK